METNIKCPKCGSIEWTRKGKTPDGEKQKLKCKKCGKGWALPYNEVNSPNVPMKQKIEDVWMQIRIVEHLDGTYSINRVSAVGTNGKNLEFHNIEYITEKINDYEKIIDIADKLTDFINPQPIKLNEQLPQSMMKQLDMIFPKNIAKQIKKFLEIMCEE